MAASLTRTPAPAPCPPLCPAAALGLLQSSALDWSLFGSVPQLRPHIFRGSVGCSHPDQSLLCPRWSSETPGTDLPQDLCTCISPCRNSLPPLLSEALCSDPLTLSLTALDYWGRASLGHYCRFAVKRMSKTLQQPEPMIGTHLADGETGQGFAQMLCFDSFWAMSPLGANVMDGIASPPQTRLCPHPWNL